MDDFSVRDRTTGVYAIGFTFRTMWHYYYYFIRRLRIFPSPHSSNVRVLLKCLRFREHRDDDNNAAAFVYIRCRITRLFLFFWSFRQMHFWPCRPVKVCFLCHLANLLSVIQLINTETERRPHDGYTYITCTTLRLQDRCSAERIFIHVPGTLYLYRRVPLIIYV